MTDPTQPADPTNPSPAPADPSGSGPAASPPTDPSAGLSAAAPVPASPVPASPLPDLPGSPPVRAPEQNDIIQYDDFAKVKLRVATVVAAEPVEKSKKLLRLQVDLGGERRQILAGIKEHYTPESLVGKQIIVVANLAPREVMRGQTSHGMLLAASDADGKVVVLSPAVEVAAGSQVR